MRGAGGGTDRRNEKESVCVCVRAREREKEGERRDEVGARGGEAERREMEARVRRRREGADHVVKLSVYKPCAVGVTWPCFDRHLARCAVESTRSSRRNLRGEQSSSSAAVAALFSVSATDAARATIATTVTSAALVALGRPYPLVSLIDKTVSSSPASCRALRAYRSAAIVSLPGLDSHLIAASPVSRHTIDHLSLSRRRRREGEKEA